jgi:hypothetical protein
VTERNGNTLAHRHQTLRHLVAMTDEELGRVDPLEANLLVAKGIPALADLDILHYQQLADQWAEAVRNRLPRAEQAFWRTPHDWKDDVNFFRLGVAHYVIEHEAGVAYNEEQRDGGPIFYTNPSDLFLNGVMDTRRGTCGNMAALHVAIGWRMGWPVSLACVASHFVCRYDDGQVTHNIEATQAGYGGFKSDPDDYLIKKYNLPSVAITSGSDLRALKPREMLGVFIGLRARHLRDTGRWAEAEADYLLARWLFPNSRKLYVDCMALAVPRGVALFETHELGSPQSLAEAIAEQYGRGLVRTAPLNPQTIKSVNYSRIN